MTDMTEQSLRRLEQLRSLLHRGREGADQRPDDAAMPNSMILERFRKWVLHYSLQHLHGPEEVAYDADELVVFCLVRNGRPYVRSFVEHYLSLGAKHIFFLDNGSTDGTVEAAREHENVTIFRTDLPFKVYQMQMKQYLIERFARHRWSLCVDIDELFDYPYSDVIGLDTFLNYLSERSYTAVLTQMLDMFPEGPIRDAPGNVDEPLKELYRFYDITQLRKYDYLEDRRIGGRGNSLTNDDIAIYRGGIKKTVFPSTGPVLSKHALIFLDDRVRPMDGNAHKTSNARVADLTCVLFHYKFTNNLYQSIRQAVERENYMKDSRKHKKIGETLDENPSLQLKSEAARELKHVNDLVHNQFLVVPKEYMVLVEDEERDRADHGFRDQPRRVVEALFESRAETKVRVREVEQLEKRVEKLQQRLKRNREESTKPNTEVRKLRQQVRRLQQQVQDARNSTSRRLLHKLGRAWAKVSGR